jgi:hypothetical protein
MVLVMDIIEWKTWKVYAGLCGRWLLPCRRIVVSGRSKQTFHVSVAEENSFPIPGGTAFAVFNNHALFLKLIPDLVGE